jgi:tetratricopeptide (TPR) repeat protein
MRPRSRRSSRRSPTSRRPGARSPRGGSRAARSREASKRPAPRCASRATRTTAPAGSRSSSRALPDPEAARAALAAALESAPRDPPLWFALGWARDSAHDIEGAEGAYRTAVEIDPRHVKARLCLAHLYSGAQLGVCAGCDEAYARAPALLDAERSLAELLEVLALDRGASEATVGRALETALALRRRTGSAEPLERLLAGLERCQALESPSPQAAARLADARARLEGALGR